MPVTTAQKVKTQKAKDYRFELRDMPGWEVFMAHGPRGAYWSFQPPVDFPNTFAWDEAAQDHILPRCDGWAGPYSGPNCYSAKAAVAAAHKHFEWVSAYKAEKGMA